MPVIHIQDAKSGSQAAITPEVGFNCFEFLARTAGRTVDVIARRSDFPEVGERPSASGTPLLFPFPNRIAHGKYTWDGKEYQLPLRPGMPHAIHGFAYDRPWRVTRQHDDCVTAEFQLSKDDPGRAHLWPADGLIEVTYRVHGATLRLDIRVHNPDTRPLPWGFGTHTYFKLPLAEDSSPSHCIIQAPVGKQWPLVDFIPTGERAPVPAAVDLRNGLPYSGLKLDDVYGDMTAAKGMVESGIMDETVGLEVIQQTSADFRELVAFTPNWMPAVCLEPYTCVTDAINLQQRGIDAGWRVLSPGEEWRGWIQITARPVVV